MKVCAEPGCPTLTRTTRCQQHTRQLDKARGTRQQRGYDSDYDKARQALADALASGYTLRCWRCNGIVTLDTLSLGHCDNDRTVLHGAEHLTECNLGTASRRGKRCPHPSHSMPLPPPQR